MDADDLGKCDPRPRPADVLPAVRYVNKLALQWNSPAGIHRLQVSPVAPQFRVSLPVARLGRSSVAGHREVGGNGALVGSETVIVFISFANLSVGQEHQKPLSIAISLIDSCSLMAGWRVRAASTIGWKRDDCHFSPKIKCGKAFDSLCQGYLSTY